MSGYFERLISRLGDSPAVQPAQGPPPTPVIDPFAEAEALDAAAMSGVSASTPAPVEPPLAPPTFAPAPPRDDSHVPEPVGALEPPPAPPTITQIVTVERLPDDLPAAPELVNLTPSPEPHTPVIETHERIVERIETGYTAPPPPPVSLEAPPNPPDQLPADTRDREATTRELEPPAPEPQVHTAPPPTPVVMIEPPRTDDAPQVVTPPAPAPETKVSIGEIVVEVVQKAAPPPARPRPARAPRRTHESPRPGVRSKRGYGIGQM